MGNNPSRAANHPLPQPQSQPHPDAPPTAQLQLQRYHSNQQQQQQKQPQPHPHHPQQLQVCSHLHTYPSSSPHPSPQPLSPRREPRRRDSLNALSSNKATAAPPSESLTSAIAHTAQQHRVLSSRNRQRSKTLHAPAAAAPENMGNEQSRQHRQVDGHGVNVVSPAQTEPARLSEPVPVPVPPSTVSSSERSSRYESPPPDPPIPSQISDLQRLPPSQTHRPPRLPLPIEEEVHTPGSPIISPTDLIPVALDHDSVEGALPRRTSVLSSTTVDEDEVVDDLGQYSIYGGVRKTIPTPIEWNQGGNKVYVTGTFTGWNRKFRLHKRCVQVPLLAPPISFLRHRA
jgi:Glycogen recognition site of AMP-activated protein kinase